MNVVFLFLQKMATSVADSPGDLVPLLYQHYVHLLQISKSLSLAACYYFSSWIQFAHHKETQ